MILDVLKALEREPGRNGKIRILRAADKKHKSLRGVLRYALDPYKRFFVRRIARVKPYRKSTVGPHHVFALLDDLASRKITGRAAETEVESVMHQLNVADQEVLRRILLKDLKCGVNTKTVNTVFKGLIPTFEVQRAKPWDIKRATFPMLAEPKIDGMRVLAFVSTEDVEYMSRGGRPVNTMSHFTSELMDLFPDGIVLDGEANVKDTFQKSIGAIKRKAPKKGAAVQYTVFDALTPEEFATRSCKASLRERRKRLGPILGADCEGLSITEAVKVRNVNEVWRHFHVIRKAGGEGSMLKDPKGTYEFKRSHVWMKAKAEDTLDVEVIGYKEGTGKNYGALGSLKFKHNGKTCWAGSGLSDNQRIKLWRERQRLIGRPMEVKFTEHTDAGRTRHARFIRFRDHDGERY